MPLFPKSLKELSKSLRPRKEQTKSDPSDDPEMTYSNNPFADEYKFKEQPEEEHKPKKNQQQAPLEKSNVGNTRTRGIGKFMIGAGLVAAAAATTVLTGGAAGVAIGIVAMTKPEWIKKPLELIKNGAKEMVTGQSSKDPYFSKATNARINAAIDFTKAAAGVSGMVAAIVLTHGLALIPMAMMACTEKGRNLLKQPMEQFKSCAKRIQEARSYSNSQEQQQYIVTDRGTQAWSNDVSPTISSSSESLTPPSTPRAGRGNGKGGGISV